MNKKILCVDDDQQILDGYKRALRKVLQVDTELGGLQGLEAISGKGPYAVVVSDMRMPGMDGIQFLSKVRELAPDTVRMMLTGMTDQQTAIDAVNEGSIFRFLTKPCSSENFAKALAAGIRQYELITAEKELLEKTLKGSIKILVDVLSLTNPAAFSRCMRIRHYVSQIVKSIGLKDTWQYEVAALLSQLGHVTVPPETLERYLVGEQLSQAEAEMMDGHAEVAKRLIENIPRLEVVAKMIANQDRPAQDMDDGKAFEGDPPRAGACILKVAMDFDILLTTGTAPQKAIELMTARQGRYEPRILEVLRNIKVPTLERTIESRKISELATGSVFAENVRTKKGMLIVASGQEVTDVLRRRLENFYLKGQVEQKVRVYVTRAAI